MLAQCGGKKPSWIIGGIVNWYSYCEIKILRFHKKLMMELPYDPIISLLSIYQVKSKIWNDICTLLFIEALITIAKIWKQPKCPSTDEWVKERWYIYIYIYIWNITQPEEKWNLAIWDNLDGFRKYYAK